MASPGTILIENRIDEHRQYLANMNRYRNDLLRAVHAYLPDNTSDRRSRWAYKYATKHIDKKIKRREDIIKELKHLKELEQWRLCF